MRVIIAGLVAVCGMQGMANAQDAEGGALLYYQHCASCHGLKADGAGPMAPVLLVQPTNLRALAYGEADIAGIEQTSGGIRTDCRGTCRCQQGKVV